MRVPTKVNMWSRRIASAYREEPSGVDVVGSSNRWRRNALSMLGDARLRSVVVRFRYQFPAVLNSRFSLVCVFCATCS